MQRVEAYTLLAEEMNKLAQLVSDKVPASRDSTVEVDRQGASGSFYHLEMLVEQIEGDRFAIVGKIHDNNSYRFSLLEERLEFKVGESN